MALCSHAYFVHIITNNDFWAILCFIANLDFFRIFLDAWLSGYPQYKEQELINKIESEFPVEITGLDYE